MLLKLISLFKFFFFYNVATRKFEMTYVVGMTFLLENTGRSQPASPRKGEWLTQGHTAASSGNWTD